MSTTHGNFYGNLVNKSTKFKITKRHERFAVKQPIKQNIWCLDKKYTFLSSDEDYMMDNYEIFSKNFENKSLEDYDDEGYCELTYYDEEAETLSDILRRRNK
jgi:hypothetical protein